MVVVNARDGDRYVRRQCLGCPRHGIRGCDRCLHSCLGGFGMVASRCHGVLQLVYEGPCCMYGGVRLMNGIVNPTLVKVGKRLWGAVGFQSHRHCACYAHRR